MQATIQAILLQTADLKIHITITLQKIVKTVDNQVLCTYDRSVTV